MIVIIIIIIIIIIVIIIINHYDMKCYHLSTYSLALSARSMWRRNVPA